MGSNSVCQWTGAFSGKVVAVVIERLVIGLRHAATFFNSATKELFGFDVYDIGSRNSL